MSPAGVTLVCFAATVAYLLQTSETKNVVHIPFPFTSHAKYHTNVARVLAKRGHQVWVTLPTYILEKEYLDTSGFNTIPYDTIPHLETTLQGLTGNSYFEQIKNQPLKALAVCRSVFDLLLKNESFAYTIKVKNPDLIVLDNIPTFYAMSVIPYRLGIPFAFLGSHYSPKILRVPFSPADMPMILLPYSNRMNFYQRVVSFLMHAFLAIIYNQAFPEDVVSTYAPEMEYLSLTDLVHKSEIFLVELDHVLDYPKPTLPNVKLIGGTATGPAKALPPQFQSFMDSAKEGVVIVTFGSFVLNLPKHISDKVLQVLLQLPMKSVFRSNLTSPDPKKILTAPWIPQNDLLGHPHTKVFVSHCGKNGQYEALYHAVPIVAFPLFSEQPYNAERVRVKGFAEVLDLNTCTAEEMRYNIMKVASEPKYKEAIIKHSRLFKELYGVPMETAAYWLEHVMEYGGDYMRSAGQQMPFYQYALLDVFFFILCLLLLSVSLLCLAVKGICMYSIKREKLE